MAKSPEELALIEEQFAASQAAADTMTSGLSRKTFVEPVGLERAPGVNFQVDDVLATDLESGRQQAVLPKPGENKPREGYGMGEFVKDSIGAESVFFNVMVAAHEAGFAPDLKWQLPGEGTNDMKLLTEGLDPQYWEVFDKAVSKEHAQFLRFKVMEELDRTERMQEYGGTAGVFAANLLNPENFLTGVATGGLAWARTGTRLVQALKSAGIATAENLVLEGALDATQETRDEWNYLYGAVAGVALGGTFGAVFAKRNIDADIRNDLNNVATREAVAKGLMTEADAQRSALRTLEDTIRTDAVAARRAALEAKAADAPSRFDMGLLARTRDTAKMQADAADAKVRAGARLSEIERRMLDEDVAKLGRAVADTKQYKKLRKAAAKSEYDARVEASKAEAQPVKDRLAEIEKKLKDAEGKHEARRELDAPDAYKDMPTKQLLNFLDGETRVKHETALTGQRARLAKALGLVRRPEKAATPAPGQTGSFGPDSLSAARVSPERDFDVRDISPNSGDLEARVEFPKTTSKRQVSIFGRQFELGIPRFDIASLLRGIDNDQVRGTFGLMVGDPVGAQKGLNPIGASEKAAERYDSAKAKFHSAYEPAFKEWLKEVKGLDGFGSWKGKKNRQFRKEFGEAIDAAQRQPNEIFSPSIRNAASKLQKLYMEFDEAAHLAGVKGFEERHSGPYSPRQYDWKRIYDNKEIFGDPPLENFMIEAIRSAFRKGDIDIDDAVIQAMGKGMYRTLIAKAGGIEGGAFNGLKLGDVDGIKNMLVDTGVDPMHIAKVVTQLEYKLSPKPGDDTGNVRFAKHRALLDEFFEMELHDINGGVQRKTFRDLFMHHDAEQLFDNYARTMSGHIALADVAGIRSRQDFDTLMNHLSDLIPDQKKVKQLRETGNDVYALITGQALPNSSGWQKTKRVMRAMRDYNFIRVMNQVGFAQIPDSAAYLTPQYAKYMKHHFPDAAKMMRRMKDGTLDHKVARELEEYIATGTDYHNNNLFSQFDDEPLSGMSKLEHGLKVGGRITQRISGLQFATDFNQRMAGVGFSNRLVSNILGRTNDLKPQKLLSLGLTPEAVARIKAQAKKHVEFDPSKAGKLMALELDKWDDLKARGDFLSAVTREARRMVQEEDVGDTHALMHNAVGKMLLQFRRFPVVAYSKQLSHGIVHGDAETLAKTGIQIGLGSLSYSVQMYIYSLTMEEKKAQEFRDKHLTPQRIFFGGIMRAGMFSLGPQAVFAAGDGMTGGGMFGMSGTRSTGLANGVAGIPAIDLVIRAGNTAANIATSVTRGEMVFDQNDAKTGVGLLPYQNAPFVKQALDMFRLMLPEKDQTVDDEDPDWGLED